MNKGNWLLQTGDECHKCGCSHVDLYESGEEICEECGYSQKKS